MRTYISLFLIFLFGPIVIITLYSFHSSASLAFPFHGVSLRWYRDLAGNPDFFRALLNSVKVAASTSVLTTILGTLTALALIRAPRPARGIIEAIHMAPMGVPGLFLGVSLLVLFGLIGLPRSLLTVTIAHTLFCLPFFVEVMRPRITYFDHSVEEAARDLGATPRQVFARVTIPLLAPNIIGAAILTLALSIDEFIITIFVTGNDTTLPIYIYSLLRLDLDPSVNAVSVIAMALSLLVIAAGGLYFLMQRRSTLMARNTD